MGGIRDDLRGRFGAPSARARIGTGNVSNRFGPRGHERDESMPRWTETEPVRFWKKVQRTEGCWWWTGGTDGNGYGAFWVPGLGRMDKAPRVSWRLTFGEIPDGMWVLHKCDHPSCVRPDHLFLGTNQENMRDCGRKGRHWTQMNPDKAKHNVALARRFLDPRGRGNGCAKLSDDAVREIRSRNTAGETQTSLAVEFGVARSTVTWVVRGGTWKHVMENA
jgi:hypothetical protein